MASAPTTRLVDLLRQHRLLSADQVKHVDQWSAKVAEPRLIAQQLVQRGWLTTFQAQHILQGRCADLVLGPYVLLDKLGEGGNGQVFKARHQTLQRLVALKVLRKELLRDAEGVGRFRREIEAVSQISHPNIVGAYDAGLIGQTWVLAMEFVEGRTLDQLVRQTGPLPVAQTAGYIRQAALGLQHAHERGLVHRDIKPANLLVARNAECGMRSDENSSAFRAPRSALVKILDLGLARLQESDLHSTTSNLTRLGGADVTQGTPDYMAPEQALDLHAADIRADIYSLGCTLFFCLAGRPPFGSGSLTETLLKHQQTPPPSLREVRADAPVELAAVLMKMLAKRPCDRYQTPDEVARAVGPLEAIEPVTGVVHVRETLATSHLLTPVGLALPTAIAAVPLQPAASARRRRWRAIAFALLALATCVGLAIVLVRGRNNAATSETQPQSRAADVPVPTELVVIQSVSTHKPYRIATATIGLVFRTDRAYTITALSPGLKGTTMIIAAENDKHVTAPEYLVFTLTRPASVYVGYDKRGTRLPAWLTDGSWQLTPESFSGSGGEAQASPYKVYARQFPAGRVTLGGNRQPPAVGADCTFLVFIKALPG